MEYRKISKSDPYSAYTDKSSSEDLSHPSQRLLDNEEDANLNLECRVPFYRRRSFIRATIAHSLIFLTYTIGFIGLITWFGQQPCPPTLTYTPIQGSVKWAKTWYDGSLGKQDKYIGDPRPELEVAWHELVSNNNLRFTKSEIEKLGKDAIELADGSGYFGQVMVYHHLHCLKSVRQALYPNAYEKTSKEHLDHCIDDIRQALMCNPDISASTFFWEDGLRRPQPDFTLYKTCVDWDHFNKWATKRMFSMYDQKSLINSKFGEYSSTS
ncbi:Major facilitator superfamily domain general substrate transporter [Penicillium cinerascens]|uniref:Major facilitator superfamily domain general substrate transporter n=1 Tax=Penicillium cinerascens TaxID=70096 RepID=A0A9W9SZI4_9EURO|nr:Major facilitator superfamily domain general substrate transporter [Penicillium cinerascens]KAJ5203807.1 Major facilitator superfamily domain general substrate transporter [Penicillium cinerascens]